MSIEGLYIHTVTVKRNVPTHDGQGGEVDAFTVVATIAGRLRPLSLREKRMGAERSPDIDHRLYCAVGSNVRAGDIVEAAGKTVRVMAIGQPSHMGHHLEADCHEIEPRILDATYPSIVTS